MKVAAIVYDRAGGADGLLVAAAARLRQRGLKLAGLVQHNEVLDRGAVTAMFVEDLASGGRMIISQPRGTAGCRIDHRGLAEAAALAAASIKPGVDLVILSKFGRAEAEGRGLRDEFAQAIAADLPVLTTIPVDRIPAWEAFLGAPWERLEPCLDAVERWCLAPTREPLVA